MKNTKYSMCEFFINAKYIINCILMPPAKWTFAFLTLLWGYSIATHSIRGDLIGIIILLFASYLIFCGGANIIYFCIRPKYKEYKKKILTDNVSSLAKLYKDEVNSLAARISHLKSEQQNTYIAEYDNMDGHAFEYFCADLLRKNGFTNVEVTQGSGDHGIDILAEKDDITYAIQCKCYSSSIGNAAIQQAHTGKSLYHRDIAAVMTNQYFTQQAKDEAAQLGVKLWNRDKINELIENSREVHNGI